tara:strand:- start:8629 stop:11034 length:2406 start_codon:yes stop_codon:yes gene_type:complete
VKQPILYIKDNDGNYQQMEMFSDETITITSKIQDVKDISKVFTDFTQPFTVPASKENNKLFQHWYNFNVDLIYTDSVLTSGFDNRIKRDALLEIDYSPYKRGKIQLESVNLRNNQPYSYSLVFYGNMVELGTLMGDDQLKTLIYLDDNYNHSYNATNVRLGVRNGLFSQSVIYPLISHTKRFYYDSSNSVAQFSGNLYHDISNTSDNQGVSWLDLKPAIKCLNIVEAIESKYNITFTRDFFGTTPFSNLYLWLSRNKGKVGGEDDVLKTRIIGDWTYTGGGSNPFDVSGSLWTFSVVKNTNTFTGQLDITTTDTEPYTLKAVDIENGVTLIEEDNLIGNETISVEFLNTGSHQVRFILESTASISFDADLIVEETIFGPSGGTTTANYEANGISTTEEIIITENVPDMTNIDFLTGIFKAFNLTAYYIDDVSDADFGKIYVDTLDNYYADAVNNPSNGSYDISSMMDISNTNIDAPTNYSGIDFKYQEPSTLLAVNHMELFNDVFGDESVRVSIDKSEIYSVELPFEHMKYERLFDDNKSSSSPYHTGTDDTYLTDILWGYSADGEFNGSFTPKAQGAVTNTLSNKLKDTNQEFNNKIKVGDIVRNLTDNTSASVLAVDSSDTLSISSDIMASGESYMILGDYNQGNYEAVLTKPLIFYGIQETGIAANKSINWISSGSSALVQYFRPSNTNEDGTSSTAPAYTLNFDNEVDEWNLTDYDGETNSLFKKFYEDYIDDLFDPKKRMYKIKTYLNKEVFLNMRLNDRFIINNRVYLINSIKTNLKTELSEIELLNVVDNQLPS